MAEPARTAASAAVDARVEALAAELRCLVCPNQTVAESDSGFARDLRRQMREMLESGRSERDIIDHLSARYGDFVRYRPPLEPRTALLWLGPGLLATLGLGTLAVVLRRRQRLGAEAFDAERNEGGDSSRRDCGDDEPER